MQIQEPQSGKVGWLEVLGDGARDVAIDEAALAVGVPDDATHVVSVTVNDPHDLIRNVR